MDAPLLFHSLEGHWPAALDFLRHLVHTNSYTGNREGVNRVGDITAERFAPLGFTAERVPSTNPALGDHLILCRAGTSPDTVAMVSHLDTVFPPEEELRNQFRWQPEGDRIYGPGTQDIKGGTVMMWLVLAALRDLAPQLFERMTWKLFWNSSEETLSHDFGEVCLQRLGKNTRAALVFEAEGRGEHTRRLVVARKGRATWRLHVSGRGAHAGGKHAFGANAIVQLGRSVQEVAALTDYPRHLTFNVGYASGGGGLNRVPHEAVAEGEFRAFSPEVYGAAKAALTALAGPREVCSVADGYRCQVAVEILSESPPWPRTGPTDRLFSVWQQAGQALGMTLEPEERGGLSDGNFLCHAVPTIDGLGPYGDNDHCSERSADGTKLPEYVEVSSFIPKAALNATALGRLLEPTG
jgi:glutamate carboxypeptidase